MEEEREGTAKRERDIVTGGDGDGGRGGGRGSGCVLPAQPAETNRQTVLFLIGEELAVAWMFLCTFHFLNAVLSVGHLTSHQCLRKGTALYLLLYIITSHSSLACLPLQMML